MVSQNFTDKAVSNLHTDRDPPVGNSAGDDGRGRLHTKISNKIDEPIPVAVVSPAGALATEKTAIAITLLNVNTWITVPLVAINNIVTLETFDAFDVNKIIIEWRISGGVLAEIRSPVPVTVTVHVIGYIVTP